MYVKTLQIKNVKSFKDSNTVHLSKNLNIFVGANNAGKSIIIKALYELQNRNILQHSDIRAGEEVAEIQIEFADIDNGYLLPHERNIFLPQGAYYPKVSIKRARSEGGSNAGQWRVKMFQRNGNGSPFNVITSEEPYNYIYPYLSKRKVVDYDRSVDRGRATRVPENLSNLIAKIDNLADSEHEMHEQYTELCEKILGFRVTAFSAEGGKQAGLRVGGFDGIPLEAMGEGVPNLLGFIANLCIAKNKLFLIEEIENDVHPKALKSLLEVIIQKTQDNNQFIISTHSNIVTKVLGSQSDSRLHKIEMSIENRIPTSFYSSIGTDPQERRKVLEDLGYEMFDFDLWEGWLILEESSAERIIREYLIRWFATGLLNKLKTMSCGGVDKVDPKFEDFNRLFLFTHLEPTYKNRAWVIVDGDTRGNEVITKLKSDYTPSGWGDDHFIALSEHNFEKYYPSNFDQRVIDVLQIQDRDKKREEKKKLLEEVIAWIETDEEQAKKEFASSAKEVISLLHNIEKCLR
ncbi:AAA family ATPase [Candidatus Woesebacteria bacterium]|nr:AAA family ATPase [Candidatus Woesebacteria bacterium]